MPRMVCNCGGSLWQMKDKEGKKYYQCGTCHATYNEPPKNPKFQKRKV